MSILLVVCLLCKAATTISSQLLTHKILANVRQRNSDYLSKIIFLFIINFQYFTGLRPFTTLQIKSNKNLSPTFSGSWYFLVKTCLTCTSGKLKVRLTETTAALLAVKTWSRLVAAEQSCSGLQGNRWLTGRYICYLCYYSNLLLWIFPNKSPNDLLISLDFFRIQLNLSLLESSIKMVVCM